jgi:hypothetical protein
VRKDDLLAKLKGNLAKIKINRELNEIKQWIAKHHPQWKDPLLPIPKFTTHTESQKFGNRNDRVETLALSIDCTTDDAPCLK